MGKVKDKKVPYRIWIALSLTLIGAVCLYLAIANRPSSVAQVAEEVLQASTGERPVPPRMVVSNGQLGYLSRDQVDGLVREVLRPAFHGWRMESADRRTPSIDSGAVLATLSGSGGKRQLLLSGKPSPDGAVFTLDILLRIAWQLPIEGTRVGVPPEWSKVCDASLKGLRRDRATLERLGITGVDYGRQGPKTWDELEAWYLGR